MSASRLALRRALHPIPKSPTQWTRLQSTRPPRTPPRRKGGKLIGIAIVFSSAAAVAYYFPTLKALVLPEPEVPQKPKAELRFEKPRLAAVSKEDNRDILSSQHLQVKNSWEHPGVYLWGSNAGRVVDPASTDKVAKLPRRFKYFDDQLLRDLKLSQDFGAAVTEKGDLVQWGLGFDQDPTPVQTLRGKDLVKITLSADRIIAISRKGAVYSVPSSRADQIAGAKEEQAASWWPSLWTSSTGAESVSFRSITPKSLSRGERIVDVAAGLHHCLLLTSRGRVFSAAASAATFPEKGQMGIPGLTWMTRPEGAYDQPHEILTLKGFEMAKVAAGDYHSVVLDKAGRVFTFGDNTYGQLGFESDSRVTFVDAPSMLPFNKFYGGSIPAVTSIAAGGLTSFYSVDATAKAPPTDAAPGRRMPPVTADLWAAGQGVYGSLGTGKWTHVTLGPVKVKALSSLFEFDEAKHRMTPIRLKALSVGTTHAAAVMDNVTETRTGARQSENSTNWGADVLFWGGNEHYQLGTGKRTNLNAPSYIGPLDKGEGDAEKGRSGEHRLCLTPRQSVRIGEGGKGRKVTLEQRVECGRHVSGVYSGV